VNPDDNTTWGLSRVQLGASDSIAAGQAKTFTFTLTAPDTPSTGIACDWQMIHTSTRFGDISSNSVGVYTYSDVPPTASYWCHVEAMYRQGIMTGSSYDPTTHQRIFSPNTIVTRKTMALFLCRGAGKDKLMSPTPHFTDVPADNFYYGWIERLADPASWYDAGNPCLVPPTSGCAPGRFCPDDIVTRAQMAVFIDRATGKCELTSPTPTFADVPDTASYYGFVERLADPASWPAPTEPPTAGCAPNPRRFCPNDSCTRAMMAVFLSRAYGFTCNDTVPSVTIDAPAPGAHLSGPASFQVTAATAVRVEFWLNNETEPHYTDTAAPFTWDVDTTTLPGGAITVTVRAYDATGMAGLAQVDVSIDNVMFTDVPHTTTYWQYVEAVARAGIMPECAPNLFCPEDLVTRKNMAEFLCRAAGKSQLNSPTPRFTDVPLSHPYYGWIERLADPASWYDAGNPCLVPPTSGCAVGRFCPDDSVTRAQMAVFIDRAKGKCALNNPVATFADVPTSVSYYGFVERLADPASWTTPPTGGCANNPPRFCPNDVVTRAQMAVFLARAYDLPL
jgi:hypothetical protein